MARNPTPPPEFNHLPQRLRRWAMQRLEMEAHRIERPRHGPRLLLHVWWALADMAGHALDLGLRLSRQRRKGLANAYDLRIRETRLHFPHLPEAFDGLAILHLTDLHLDGMDDLAGRTARKLRQLPPWDLLVLTGDTRLHTHGPHEPCMEQLEALMAGMPKAPRGALAVLGNHDSARMVPPLESLGFRVLVNESMLIGRDDQAIRVVGTDDVHAYFTEDALDALAGPFDEFTIALVHSPELAIEAAAGGADLYLCGHTHGGQICLPGPLPIIKHLTCCRSYWHGQWRHRNMRGITSRGVGTSGIPVRFHAPPEAWHITLRRGPAQG